MATTLDTLFTRALLKIVLADVRKAFPHIKTSEAGLTETRTGSSNRYFFFEYQGWHWEGQAFDAYEAKSKAWNAYLEKHSERN